MKLDQQMVKQSEVAERVALEENPVAAVATAVRVPWAVVAVILEAAVAELLGSRS